MTPGVLVRTSGSTLSEMRSHGTLLADKYCNVMFYTIILAVLLRINCREKGKRGKIRQNPCELLWMNDVSGLNHRTSSEIDENW